MSRRRWLITVLISCALACGGEPDPDTLATGIKLTVTNNTGTAITRIELEIFDDGRAILDSPVRRPMNPGATLGSEETVALVLEGVPDRTRVTLKVVGKDDGGVSLDGSAVVTIEEDQFVDVTIDLTEEQTCSLSDNCEDSVDNNCNDAINEGCCFETDWFTFGVTDSIGTQASLTVGDDGTVHIAYHDGEELHYARGELGVFEEQILTDGPEVEGQTPKIAIDSLGNVHIMSIANDGEGGTRLVHHYTTTPGGDFQSAPWAEEQSPTAPSFAIDRDGDRLHVAFGMDNGFIGYLSSLEAGNLPTENAPVQLQEGRDASLSLSPGGVPHAVFVTGGTERMIGHRFEQSPNTWINGDWTDNENDAIGNDIGTLSLAIVEEGRIEALVYEAGRSAGTFVTRQSTVDHWDNNKDVLSPMSKRGANPSIALDSFGVRHVVFENNVNIESTLEYGCREATAEDWLSTDIAALPASSAATLISDRAIATDETGCVHVVYELLSGGIEYARRCPPAP